MDTCSSSSSRINTQSIIDYYVPFTCARGGDKKTYNTKVKTMYMLLHVIDTLAFLKYFGLRIYQMDIIVCMHLHLY